MHLYRYNGVQSVSVVVANLSHQASLPGTPKPKNTRDLQLGLSSLANTLLVIVVLPSSFSNTGRLGSLQFVSLHISLIMFSTKLLSSCLDTVN